VSSAEVYRPSKDLLTEDSPVGPINPYGGTKAAAEVAAFQMALAGGMDLMVARPFPHFGPGQSPVFALPAFCRRILDARNSGERSIRVGNLDPVRDYLYVTDVARAYHRILAKGDSGGIYNICTGNGSSMGDMVRTLVRISGVPLDLEKDPALFRPVDVISQVGDPSRMEALGWSPEIDRNDGMRRLFSWWEANT
jgi:GDP-4-dehydro-6-deoxy-D-mannose reductase